jgi:arylsulfatase A-like enzyme
MRLLLAPLNRSTSLTVAIATVLCLAASLPALGADKPNIIFILADDLGYGELGCYGQQKIATPHLDRMAAEGMRFTQFYAGSTVCAPSRSVLMTGQHLGHTRVRGNAGAGNSVAQMLYDADFTVAELFKRAGYCTGLVGKWGLGQDGDEGIPNKQGFDYFFGFLSQHHAHNHYPDFLWRNQEKISLPNVVTPIGAAGGGYATEKVQYAGDRFAEESLQFVEMNRSSPFFLYLALTVPHANNERTRALKDGAEVPDYGRYADTDWTNPHKGQAAMITRMDEQIGALLERLRQLGLDENTLVIFSSDNGPHKEGGNDPEFFAANGPLSGYKRSLTDGGIRVPFIARWPGKVPAGKTSLHVGYFGDFLATVAELTGQTPPSDLDSISIVPALTGNDSKQRQHEFLYWEFYEGGVSQAVLLKGRWKGIRLKRSDAPIQLYDLASDIAEKSDIAAEHREIVDRIARIMERTHVDNEHWTLARSADKRN